MHNLIKPLRLYIYGLSAGKSFGKDFYFYGWVKRTIITSLKDKIKLWNSYVDYVDKTIAFVKTDAIKKIFGHP